jgi:SAM-dependent methyltransferase
MGLYARHLLPRLTDLAMRSSAVGAERRRWVPRAAGTVLEIGAGSGLNLRHYGPDVRRLYALDPSEELRRMARRRAVAARVPVTFLAGSAEALPLRAASVDVVVMTWTLCTVPDALRAVRELGRVLVPEGRLIFAEHGRAPDPGVARWQDRLTPLWRRVAGGCHLNRRIVDLLGAGGFATVELEQGYIAGPRIGSYLYRGVARPAGAAAAAAV